QAEEERPPRTCQDPARSARRRGDAGIDLRQAYHLRHAGKRRRSVAGVSGRGRPIRHAALRRQGLEGPRTRPPVDDPDGGKGSAARQCGDGEVAGAIFFIPFAATQSHASSTLLHLPLKGEVGELKSALALRSEPGGGHFLSLATLSKRCELTPTPPLPLSGGGSAPSP